MVRVEDLGDCPRCLGRGAKLSYCRLCDDFRRSRHPGHSTHPLPLLICPTCLSLTVRYDLLEVGPQILCEACGTANPTFFVCASCHARLPYGELVKGESPSPANQSAGERCGECGKPWFSGENRCPSCKGRNRVPSNIPKEAAHQAELPPIRSEGPQPSAPKFRRSFVSPPPKDSAPAHRMAPGERQRPPPGPRKLLPPTTHAPSARVVRNGEDRRGLVNGRVNGLLNGRVNGLVNGRVNGLVNGRVNGLVNGLAVVNGRRVNGFHVPRRRLLSRLIAIGASILMLYALAASLVSPPQQRLAMEIDGSFGDWRSVPSYEDGTPSTNLDVQLRSVSLEMDGPSLFLRAQVYGRAFGGPSDWETLYAFLDTDGDVNTGYELSDFGADLLVRASGSGGVVHEALVMRFSSLDRGDWNGWQKLGSVRAAAGGSQVEVAMSVESLEAFNRTALRSRFAFDDNEGETSHTVVPVGLEGGALRVVQRGFSTTVGAGSSPFLEVQFEALGAGTSVVVERVDLETSAGAFSSISAPFLVVRGTPVVRMVSVNATGLSAGSIVSAGVREVLANRPYAVIGVEARAYVAQPPPEKRIDGLFADWPNPMPDADAAPVWPSPLNIVSRDGAMVADRAFLYARLGGSALEGRLVPDRIARPQSGQGRPGGPSESVSPPPPRLGEDYVRFYVGSNANGTDGLFLNGSPLHLLVEVRGRGGRATNASAYTWSGSQWLWRAGVTVEAGAEELEVAVVVPTRELNMTRLVVVTADWSRVADTADTPTRSGTRGDPGFSVSNGPNFQTLRAKSLTKEPTVDGNCGTVSGEYEGADTGGNANLKLFVGRRSSIARVFVCLEITADTSDDGTSDWGELLFDQEHDDSAAPLPNDRRFRRTGGGAGGTFTQEKGDGSSWVPCGGSCDSGNAAYGKFNNSREVYEFKISFTDVWGSNTTLPNEVAGFAIVALDDDVVGSKTYTWGSSNVKENVPSTWGQLEIQEFQPIVTVAMWVLLPLWLAWRLRARGGLRKWWTESRG